MGHLKENHLPTPMVSVRGIHYPYIFLVAIVSAEYWPWGDGSQINASSILCCYEAQEIANVSLFILLWYCGYWVSQIWPVYGLAGWSFPPDCCAAHEACQPFCGDWLWMFFQNKEKQIANTVLCSWNVPFCSGHTSASYTQFCSVFVLDGYLAMLCNYQPQLIWYHLYACHK